MDSGIWHLPWEVYGKPAPKIHRLLGIRLSCKFGYVDSKLGC